MDPGRASLEVVLFAATTTLTPARPSAIAHSRPMPREAPVMMATFPARLMLASFCFDLLDSTVQSMIQLVVYMYVMYVVLVLQMYYQMYSTVLQVS